MPRGKSIAYAFLFVFLRRDDRRNDRSTIARATAGGFYEQP
mgnify:CR=1 FL=1